PLVAESVDRGPDHPAAEGERRRRRIGLQLFVEDIVLHRGPAGAAIFLRPMRNAPALLVQDAPPGDHLVLGEMTALDDLLPRRGRHIVAKERPPRVAKRHLFLGESEIHRTLLAKSISMPGAYCTTSNNPAAPMPPPT